MEPISLDRPIGEDEDSNLSDFIEEMSAASPRAASACDADCAGEAAEVSSMKSPRLESSSSPIGRSSEIGSMLAFMTLLTLSSG